MNYSYYYLIPYYKNKNILEVLLGIKKSINKHDGFIHTNPGQTIICGGKYKIQTQNDHNKLMVQKIIDKFNRQCGGILINPNNSLHRMTHILEFNGKYIGFYRMNHDEYHYFARTHKQNHHRSSIIELKWIHWKYAIRLFSNIKNNPPCNGYIHSEIDQYIKMIPKIHPTFLNEYLDEFIMKSLPNINQYGKKSKYYPFLKLYLYEYIMEKSKIDWFYTMMIIFSRVV